MNATASDASIATEAPTGIGRMYGPIIPDTNAIGRIAAITVNVARMVGIPDFVDRLYGRDLRRAVAHLEMAVDVLDDDDRIVDQNADGEDQREQRDAVERVAERVVHEQRECERHRYSDEHDRGLAPAEEEPDEQP